MSVIGGNYYMTEKELNIKSNIINKEEFQEYAEQTLTIIKEAISKSLGYYGSTTVLEDNYMKDNITKDGFTILNNIKFNNSISATILGIIKDISGDLVRTVGDGSTSSVIVSYYLYKSLIDYIKKTHIAPKTLMDLTKNVVNNISTELEKIATPITMDNLEVIKYIASVSNNNDDGSGNIIYDIYKKIGLSGMLFLEESTNEEDSYEIHEGLTTNYGYVDKIFVNRENQIDADFSNPLVLLFNEKLTKDMVNTWIIDLLGSISANKNVPLIICAPAYDIEVISTIKNNIQINQRRDIHLQVALTTYATNREDYQDLALYLNAPIYDPNSEEWDNALMTFNASPELFITQSCGHCESIHMNERTTTYVGGKFIPAKMDAWIERLQTEIDGYKQQDPSSHVDIQIYNLRKRIANLKGQIATLFVGGKTERERKTRKYLLEDSIAATKSAIDHGYVPGMGLTIPKVVTHTPMAEDTPKEYTVIENIIHDAFISTAKEILENKKHYLDEDTVDNNDDLIRNLIINRQTYNLKTQEFEDDDKTHIINSVETEQMILNSAISIVNLLVTSNQYLSKMPQQ